MGMKEDRVVWHADVHLGEENEHSYEFPNEFGAVAFCVRHSDEHRSQVRNPSGKVVVEVKADPSRKRLSRPSAQSIGVTIQKMVEEQKATTVLPKKKKSIKRAGSDPKTLKRIKKVSATKKIIKKRTR